jgi:hypothetical protein
MAASHFLDHPGSGLPAMLSGHQPATLDRMRRQAVFVLGQETTCLHDGTTPPQAGRGTGKGKSRAESRRPPTVALPPERVN